MNNKCKLFKYMSICSLTFSTFSLYANERAYVFCYSPNEDTWQWLINSSGDRIELEGKWVRKKFGTYSFNYFLLENRKKLFIKNLQKQCMDNFGYNYYVPQPAKTSLLNQSWDVFALRDNIYINSKIDIRFYFKSRPFTIKNSCVIKIPYDPTRPKFLNETDIEKIVDNRVC